MKLEDAKVALSLAKKISLEIDDVVKPPSEGYKADSHKIVYASLMKNTRSYLERISNQINGSYEKGWYDGCAVMMRRLLETLIIESFETHNLSSKIKNTNGDFFYLSDLITITLNETTWNLSRNAKRALPKLKDIGDKSAHSRYFLAHREDIDKIIEDFRLVIQELLLISKLK